MPSRTLPADTFFTMPRSMQAGILYQPSVNSILHFSTPTRGLLPSSMVELAMALFCKSKCNKRTICQPLFVLAFSADIEFYGPIDFVLGILACKHYVRCSDQLILTISWFWQSADRLWRSPSWWSADLPRRSPSWRPADFSLGDFLLLRVNYFIFWYGEHLNSPSCDYSGVVESNYNKTTITKL